MDEDVHRITALHERQKWKSKIYSASEEGSIPYLWVKCLPILSLSARNGYIQKVRRRLTTAPDT